MPHRFASPLRRAARLVVPASGASRVALQHAGLLARAEFDAAFALYTPATRTRLEDALARPGTPVYARLMAFAAGASVPPSVISAHAEADAATVHVRVALDGPRAGSGAPHAEPERLASGPVDALDAAYRALVDGWDPRSPAPAAGADSAVVAYHLVCERGTWRIAHDALADGFAPNARPRAAGSGPPPGGLDADGSARPPRPRPSRPAGRFAGAVRVGATLLAGLVLASCRASEPPDAVVRAHFRMVSGAELDSASALYTDAAQPLFTTRTGHRPAGAMRRAVSLALGRSQDLEGRFSRIDVRSTIVRGDSAFVRARYAAPRADGLLAFSEHDSTGVGEMRRLDAEREAGAPRDSIRRVFRAIGADRLRRALAWSPERVRHTFESTTVLVRERGAWRIARSFLTDGSLPSFLPPEGRVP